VNKQDIEKYLRMLGEELLKRQVTGEILLVGGAVMLLNSNKGGSRYGPASTQMAATDYLRNF
jgi:flavin-dependent dehydrogenase